jgi:hypothetical protein
MRDYAPAVDSSVTPIEAGRAIYALSVSSPDPRSAEVLPPVRGPYAMPTPTAGLFSTAGAPWEGPSPRGLIDSAAAGFTRAQLAYLDSIAALPLWIDFELVARAARMDFAGAAFATPFRADLSPAALPIVSFAPLKRAAYANTARAARHLANGRPAEAERTLRSTIGFGLRLMDDGNVLIDDLVGAVIVGIGMEGLEDLYRVTRNPNAAYVANVRTRPFATADTASVMSSDENLLRAIADPALSRGLRVELTRVASLGTCTNVAELLGGRSKERAAALARARELYARTPGEEAVFDLMASGPDRRVSDGRALNWGQRALLATASVPATILRNPRIVNCAEMVWAG